MKKTATPQEVMLSVAEVAARLGPSENTIYRWCEKGIIAHRKYPAGSVYITESEVLRIERESTRAAVKSHLPESPRINQKVETNGNNGNHEASLKA